MDAKVGDWVVTPRRGKAVEINALWYNALRLLEGWLREERTTTPARRARPSTPSACASRSIAASGTREGGYLYDVVDGEQGDDSAVPARISSSRSRSTIRCSIRRAGSRCSTWCANGCSRPSGLRSLAPGHPDYKPTYYGDLRARDAAYHQGTVWAWLIGPFIDAWLKVHPGRSRRRAGSSSTDFEPASRRSLHRLDQRSLRRRSAVTRRAAASPRPGASPRCCAAW